MIEVSVVVISLLGEALFIALIVLLVWTVLAIKRNKKDRQAVARLIEQVKHQSQIRLETTGSFLSEKYRFEGDDLKKGVKSIDKAEKKFIQKFIRVYLGRDADGLTGMDASMAEMIDAYKSLSPVMPDAQTMETLENMESSSAEEVAELRETNEKLREELSITKETMSNMISEFGNMFGGGHDHELANQDVVGKLEEKGGKSRQGEEVVVEDHPDDSEQGGADEEPDDIELEEDAGESDEDVVMAAPKESKADRAEEDVLIDDDVDELLDSIDLSDSK